MRTIDRRTKKRSWPRAISQGLSTCRRDRPFCAAQTRNRHGARSLRARNLARMINVSRWAFGAGCIAEVEAWEPILPVAERYGLALEFLAECREKLDTRE